MTQLEDVLGPREVAQSMHAEIAQFGALRKRVEHEIGRGRREHHLSAMSERP